MNKIVIIAVFIFWVAVSFFYANTLVKQNTVSNNLVGLGNNNYTPVNNNQGQGNTLADVLPQHNSTADCWLAINGKVYDVTSYIYAHPGGTGEILKYCGQDASKGFASKDKFIAQDHSQFAYAELASFYVGNLTDSVGGGQGSPQADNTSSGQVANDATNSNTNTNTNTNTPAPVTYTLTTALVAQHNTPADCWVTANGNVYSVSSYLTAHPGGASAIIPYCGADIAAAFASQGHSASAVSIMASYKIGTLGSAVDSNTVTSVDNNPAPRGGGESEDDDDEEEDDD